MLRRDRILIVQHDAAEVDRLTSDLAGLGYVVRTVPEYADALDLVDAWSPNLILLDLHLPRLDGWRFLEEYGQRLGYRAPVIAHAAVPELDRSARSAGAAGFLPAPLQLTPLLKAMARHL